MPLELATDKPKLQAQTQAQTQAIAKTMVKARAQARAQAKWNKHNRKKGNLLKTERGDPPHNAREYARNFAIYVESYYDESAKVKALGLGLDADRREQMMSELRLEFEYYCYCKNQFGISTVQEMFFAIDTGCISAKESRRLLSLYWKCR